jgi:hypothetical protein
MAVAVRPLRASSPLLSGAYDHPASNNNHINNINKQADFSWYHFTPSS